MAILLLFIACVKRLMCPNSHYGTFWWRLLRFCEGSGRILSASVDLYGFGIHTCSIDRHLIITAHLQGLLISSASYPSPPSRQTFPTITPTLHTRRILRHLVCTRQADTKVSIQGYLGISTPQLAFESLCCRYGHSLQLLIIGSCFHWEQVSVSVRGAGVSCPRCTTSRKGHLSEGLGADSATRLYWNNAQQPYTLGAVAQQRGSCRPIQADTRAMTRCIGVDMDRCSAHRVRIRRWKCRHRRRHRRRHLQDWNNSIGSAGLPLSSSAINLPSSSRGGWRGR